MKINPFSNISKSAYFIVSLLFICNIALGQNKGGRWQFENNANDSCWWNTNNYNGLLSGSAVYSNIEPLAEGSYYLSLEKENEYGVFRIGDNNDLDFQKESLAISLWVYPIPGNDNPQFLLIKGNRSGNSKTDNYSLRINSVENKNYLEFLTNLESGTLRSVTSSFEIPQYQWNFIAVFYDYINSKIYLWNDMTVSTPIDTFNFSADLFPNDDSLFIGTAGKSGLKRFWGRIDDLRIGSDISQIMNNAAHVEDKNKIDNTGPFELYQNYPNPFNPETNIRFYLPKDAEVKLNVYNVLGKLITTLVNSEVRKGFHEYIFNAVNLPSGVYYYKLDFNNFSVSKIMIFIK